MKTLTGLLLTLVVSACGGESQDPLAELDPAARGSVSSDGRDAFIGTWRLTSHTMAANCGGSPPEVNVSSASLTWSKGGTSQLVAEGTGGFCSLTARVTASTASAVAGQGCIASDGAYGVYSISRAGYAFTLSSDGETAREESSGTVEYSDGGVVSMTCDYLGRAAYQKAGD